MIETHIANDSLHETPSVLLVSSSENILAEGNAFLSDSELNVYSCSSAKLAIRYLRQKDVAIIVCDSNLKDMDGWRLCRLVRSGVLTCKADTPVILLTETWSKRIAEVTAREFDINALLHIEDLASLTSVLHEFIVTHTLETLKAPKLLVVEDQQDTSDLIRRIMQPQFDIDTAFDGEEGLNTWRAGNYDLVLLDIMLPKLSGKDILSAIMAEKPNQAVVMMTAHASGELAEELMLEGATDFICKPFRSEQLRKVCNLACHREDYMVSNAQFAEQVNSLAKQEKEYKRLSESYHHLLHSLQTVVMELDDRLNITFVNNAWQSMMGYSLKETLGNNLNSYLSPEQARAIGGIENRLNSILSGLRSNTVIELCLKDKKGENLWAEFKITRASRTGDHVGLTVCMDNITDRKKAQNQLEHLAIHDPLTGLYNRHFFNISLDKIAANAARGKQKHALLYIDLDYFKVVNDTLGHHAGDEVLRDVSKKIIARIRGADVVCRIGGDEFAVLLHDINETIVSDIADDLLDLISSVKMNFNGKEITVACSIGISLIDGKLTEPDEYLMQADIALYVAKDNGRNGIHVFNQAFDANNELHRTVNWLHEVRQAIEEERVLLFFQPIYHIGEKRITYYEALVRIKNRDGQLIFPDSFIPALESLGEMYMLDRCVFQLAMRAMREEPHLKHVAINLSAQAFKHEQLVPTIVQNLHQFQINANQITIELTESASLFNVTATQRIIESLHELGCRFAVDDFGSGFSSFSYLKQLPADVIKLDGSFIRRLDVDEVDQKLVRSIIQVIQSLGKKAVAEFVENQAILDLLESYGVDYAQGYHIGKPAPLNAIIKSIDNSFREP